MYAIVKFYNQDTPVLFGISNTGYAWRFSTMKDVEWVSSVVVNSSGTVSSLDNGRVGSSVLHDTIIKPWLPGAPDPLARDEGQ